MPPILWVGMLAAAAAAAVFYISYLVDPRHRVLGAAAYTAFAALIPAVVYTIIEWRHPDQLLWWGMGLALALALLFFATRDQELRWALALGVRGLRLWVLISLASAIGYTLALRFPEEQYFSMAILFGALVGASEILARYRDAPLIALSSPPGLLYLALNGIVSAAAFALLEYYQDSIFPQLQNDPLLMSIVAGFGAMVVMRSKLFSLKTAEGDEFAVGPDAVITIFLRSIDRAIDRYRSLGRQRLAFATTQALAKTVRELGPAGIQRVADFIKATLPSYQNLSSEETRQVIKAVEDIANEPRLAEQLKLMRMAFGLLVVTGEDNYNQLMADLQVFLESVKQQEQPAAPISSTTSQQPPPQPPAGQGSGGQ